MLKVQCEACGAPYEVDPRRVPANGMKMRCPGCGATVHVAPANRAPTPDLDLELDLPAKATRPGTAKAALGGGLSLPPVKGVSLPSQADDDLSDLPIAKRPKGPAPRLSASAEGDLEDLPMRKAAPEPSLKQTTPGVLHGGEPRALAPAPRPSVPAHGAAFDAGLDLPAPKAKLQEPRKSAISDLDLPAPKTKAPPSKAATAELDLPAAKLKTAGENRAATAELDLPAAKAKPQEMSERALSSELDLPAPKTKAGFGLGKGASSEMDLPMAKAKPGADELDLPAPKAKAPVADFDLPIAKGQQTRDGIDLPLPKAQAPAPGRPSTPFSLDPPAPSGEGGAMSRKSFAKPASTARMPLAPHPEPAPVASGGTLPKDSLALEPKPFFASAPPVGMFGKLDEVGVTVQKGGNDLVDLPAPNDLPAVKRAQPKATALGLGQRREALELPAEFGAPARDADAGPTRPGAQPIAASSGAEAIGRAVAAGPMLDLDLPAPQNLPAVKKRAAPAATALGLGMGALQAAREAQQLNQAAPDATPKSMELSLDLPPMIGRGNAQPAADRAAHDGSFGAFDGELELEPRTAAKHDSLGDLEPIVLPSAQTSNTNTVALHTLELAPHDLMMTGGDGGLSLSDTGDRQRHAKAAARRSELGLELKGMLELSSEGVPAGRASGPSFGEIDLGMGREPTTGTMPLPTASRATQAGLGPSAPVEDAEILPSDEELALRDKRRKKALRRLPAWVIPLGLVVGLGTSGVALGLFTDHGYFGVYLLEELLPAAGDPESVRAAIASAEQKAQSDGYVDVRKALVTLSDARNEAGLNRELLARSLLHEALYQLRFGEDTQSAQRSAAILARALERGASSPALSLGRAADAARRGQLGEAKQLLEASAALGDDPYRQLVAGEIALLDGKHEAAASAFEKAARAGARAKWGYARALIAAGKLDAAEQAAKATLSMSPRHAAAHALLADRALARNELELALDHARVAAGARPVDGVLARPSRAERARALAIEGAIEEQRDHPREALAAYERALAADPLDVDVLLGSGRMLMRLGRPQDALSRFDSALSARPSDKPDARGRIPMLEAGSGAIQALLALQRPKEALSRSSSLLPQFPNEPEVKLWHGHVLMALERWDEAEAVFRETVEKAPKLFAGYVGLSQLLFKRNRPEEAARALSLATGRVDDSAEVRRMLGNSELARNHLPEAIHQFEAALHFNPNDAGALFGLVVAQRKSGAMDAAEKALDQLEKVDPTFPGLALERGQLFENRGAYDRAIALYRSALEQRPSDTELKLRLGAALVTGGQVDEAEAVLSQVIKERPNSAEAEHYLGRVLFARKETAQAAQRFERAVNNDMLKAEYHMYLAWALLEQGNFGGALTSVQKAIERDPNLGDARWLLGRIQLRTGAVRDALVNFQAALRLKPSRVEALANMGDAYDELRDSAQAIKSYQDALKRAPEHGEWWYRLGQLQLDKGRRDEARVALSEAVMRGDRARERPSWLADAHRLYGDVLRESKRGPEASDHYKLFLELAPLGHPDRPEIEQLLYQTRDARR